MKKFRLLISMILVLALCISTSSLCEQDVQASTKRPKNIKKVYLNWIKSHRDSGYVFYDGYKDYIKYKDVDGDGIKEAFYCNGGDECDVVLTYRKGKVLVVSKNMTHTGFVKLNKKYYICESDHYMVYNTVYKMKNGKLIPYCAYTEDRDFSTGDVSGYYKYTKWSSKEKDFTSRKHISEKTFYNFLSKLSCD